MGSRRTTIISSTVAAPVQPPAQPVVQSGRISGTPVTYTVGASRVVNPAADYPVQVQPYNPFRNAYNTIPYVPFRPRTVYNPVIRPVTPPQSVTNTNLNVAGTIKDEVCDDILGDPVRGVDSFTVTGNGKATRFRFPVAGAPSQIAVTNNSTGATVASSTYDVLVRGDSVSWLIFDTAPADGVSYSVKYVIGDNPFIRTVRVTPWTEWLVKLNNLQRQLLAAKSSATTDTSYRYGYSTIYNRAPETSAYDKAIEAVVQLKEKVAKPADKMDLKSIEVACNYLEDQLARIGAGTGKRSQADSTYGGALVAAPSISRGANIVFEFDDRYSSFSSSGSEYSYGGRFYTRQYDNDVKAFYFDLNSGRLPKPVYYSGNSGGDDNNNNYYSSSSKSSPLSSLSGPKAEKSGTGVTGGKSGVSAAETRSYGDSAVDVEMDERVDAAAGYTAADAAAGRQAAAAARQANSCDYLC